MTYTFFTFLIATLAIGLGVIIFLITALILLIIFSNWLKKNKWRF